ncbi:P27 family phage terminase small subunit [Vibrio cholerae]
MKREFHTNIPLSDEQYKKFLDIKNMIETERELSPTYFDTICMLVINISLLIDAQNSINEDGAIIYSTSKYGASVPKANPANEIAARANVAIKGYLEALLLTPRSKAMIDKALNEKAKEDDDPLTVALKQRSSRR